MGKGSDVEKSLAEKSFLQPKASSANSRQIVYSHLSFESVSMWTLGIFNL